MRTLLIALVSVLVSAHTPIAFAGDHDGGGKGGKGGKGGHGGHNHGGGGGGGSKGPVASIVGAGQRLHFTFGGNVKLRDGKAKGEFALVVHPIAPQGTTLSVACGYKLFTDVTITGNTATFTGHGLCARILTDGSLEHFVAKNIFQIVDNSAGDQIDVNFVGPTGIAVPAGELAFGNFTVTPIPAP
ncbi:MAG: hypothetical protein IAG13_13090 [Deltaproteobacteria bacterium]|nr:hypothetical protein [Nannocystaceae bacterium]